jgi:mono/diheme cytochrome c family protein
MGILLEARTGQLFAGLMVVALAAGCRGNRSEQPPVHLQQNMDFQKKGDAQERNDFFYDGRWMREPPAGTVPARSVVTDDGERYLKADDHLYRGIALDGTFVDALPAGMELDAAVLARGEERYNIYCAPCHGHAGHGDGVATRRGGGMTVQPVNFHRKDLQAAPLGYFLHVINQGKGEMQPYAAQIHSYEDRWAIAAWTRVLQVSHRADPDDTGRGQ